MKDTDVIAAVAKQLHRMRGVLWRFNLLPPLSAAPLIAPYLVKFQQLTVENNLDPSGIHALQTFTTLWDTRITSFLGREIEILAFSQEERETLMKALSEFNVWLAKNFPEIQDSPGE